jgi:hypothetical protein
MPARDRLTVALTFKQFLPSHHLRIRPIANLVTQCTNFGAEVLAALLQLCTRTVFLPEERTLETLLPRPQQSQRKPAQVDKIAHDSNEHQTPEPFFGPVCFRGGSDG